MLEIFVNNQRVTQFDNFSLQRSLDNVGDIFSFTSPFFPGSQKYRDLFRPFSYYPVVIKIQGRTILTGTVEMIQPNVTVESSSVTVSGRSKTGVIVDATFEKSDFPVQFTKRKLDSIVNSLISKFQISSRFFEDPGPTFEDVGPQSAGETVFSFIQNLARQRQFLISQTEGGNLLFWRANTKGKAVAAFKEGQQGLTLTSANYDGAVRFSRYDIFGQEYGKNDNYATLQDPAISITRPKSQQANDTNQANIQDLPAWAATSAIAQSIRIPINLVG